MREVIKFTDSEIRMGLHGKSSFVWDEDDEAYQQRKALMESEGWEDDRWSPCE